MSHHHHHHSKPDYCQDFQHPEERQKERRILGFLIIINLVGMLAEVVGGLMTNSLALLSDAGHMFTHLFSILVAYIAIVMAMRTKSQTMSFGYFRMEILAAFFNALTIFAIVMLIVLEAIWKIMENKPVMVEQMIWVAVFGLIINLIGAWMLVGVAHRDINLKAVLVHLLSDTFSSVAILIGGAIIHYTHWYFVDAIASLIIAAVIGYWGLGLLRSSTKVLLQAVPESIDSQEVVRAILEIPQVKQVHDVHIWELTSEKYVMTGHILTDNLALADSKKIIDDINHMVKERFSIGHTTFQMEVIK